MTVPDVAFVKICQFCEARTPPDLRDKMRLEAAARGNSVTISDCSRLWRGEPGEWMRMKIAQLRYDPRSTLWSVYWADRNERWHRYDDLEPSPDVEALIREIDHDPTCIFFG